MINKLNLPHNSFSICQLNAWQKLSIIRTIATALRLHLIVFTVLSLLITSIQISAQPQARPETANTLIFQADEWCPYNCSDDAKNKGYIVDILNEVYGKLGYRVVYQTINWSRVIRNARLARTHGIIGALKDDAKDFVFPTSSIGNTVIGLWGKSEENIQVDQLSDLAPLNIAIVKGYTYGDELDSYFAEHNERRGKLQITSGGKPLARNIELLKKGRIDAIVEDNAVIQYQLHQQNLTKHISHINDLNSDQIFVAFSPNNPQSPHLAMQLERGMHELRKSGKLERILAKYGLTDWQ